MSRSRMGGCGKPKCMVCHANKILDIPTPEMKRAPEVSPRADDAAWYAPSDAERRYDLCNMGECIYCGTYDCMGGVPPDECRDRVSPPLATPLRGSLEALIARAIPLVVPLD